MKRTTAITLILIGSSLLLIGATYLYLSEGYDDEELFLDLSDEEEEEYF